MSRQQHNCDGGRRDCIGRRRARGARRRSPSHHYPAVLVPCMFHAAGPRARARRRYFPHPLRGLLAALQLGEERLFRRPWSGSRCVVPMLRAARTGGRPRLGTQAPPTRVRRSALPPNTRAGAQCVGARGLRARGSAAAAPSERSTDLNNCSYFQASMLRRLLACRAPACRSPSVRLGEAVSCDDIGGNTQPPCTEHGASR